MKIIVTSGTHNIRIGIPTILLFNRPMVWLGLKMGRKYASEKIDMIPREAAYALCAEIRRIKKKHGSWELVDVIASDGSKVKIII